MVINQKDYSPEEEYVFEGKITRMSQIEATLWHFLREGNRIHLAFDGDAVCGIMVWAEVFPLMKAIRILYVPETHRDKGIGVGLVKALGDAKCVLFQTSKRIEPKFFLKQIQGRPEKLFEDEKMVTWKMVMGD